MKKFNFIGCGIFVLLISLAGCGADHSRHFSLTILAEGSDSNVECDIESLFEKSDNTEESTNKPDIKPEVTLPLTGLMP